MAKKKGTPHPHPHPHPSQPQSLDLKQHHPTAEAMDDPSVQIQNLKKLNSVLLTETTQRRQQLESLLHVGDTNLALELENAVLLAFLEARMREMGFRFDEVVGEGNERGYEVAALKGELNGLENEREQLKDELVAGGKRLMEAEDRERMVRDEVEKLRLEGERLLEQRWERERVIRQLEEDKDLALRSSQESAMVIEMLKVETEGIMREKNEIEKLNKSQVLKIIGLENELKQLHESLKNSRNEEALMRSKILQLEGSIGLAVEKEQEMAMEIRALMKDKKEMEKSIQMLTERSDGVSKVLDMVQKELENKQHEIDETIRVRDEIEQVKVIRENEIVELQGEVYRLKDVVDKLKESCREFEEKNKQLLSQVEHYKDSVDQVMLEKDSIRKGFDEEKNKVEKLELQVAGMKDKIEQTAVELGQMRSEKEKLTEKNKMLESHVHELQGSLVETQRESDDLRAKNEFSNRALAMLKSTAALVCQYKEGAEVVVSNERKLEEEIQPYAKELDAIRNAFKSKDEMVDDMKQQVVSLQKSVAKAHKTKSLWTLISSATTIFAAAIAAYVARGR
ncbi:uncharacterized protein LOC133294704 [Gastrolobium bilobum]|uniref:uncharacterized protein LOC133294704 n=1 Tax=Gastrolobium bilobum TaxID=150636 RepID=UPI002AAF8150|nr:uncharacterized protein LOC133294704 [Gastrolobium bilobum]